MDVNKRKAPPPATVEGEEPPPDGDATTTVSQEVEVLPEASVFNASFLSRHFTQFITTQYKKIYTMNNSSNFLDNNMKLPVDAILSNFPFPLNTEVFFDMDP